MLTVGLDVGSTTVKAVVIDRHKKILWKKYERHRTRQMEKAAEFLESIRSELGVSSFRLFTTGSGGGRISKVLHLRHFQEVNALSFAIEDLHRNSGSAFELGGQDAKFILWRENFGKFSSMNDRCAGGTGATIDRIQMKLNLSTRMIQELCFDPNRVYPVAGKCGVFAETDINSLQKQGVPEDALLLSLFNAIVEQNLAVLLRGHIPRPPLLLLGGPNVFFPALQEAWRYHILPLWEERGIPYDKRDHNSIFTPDEALFYGAYGAACLGQIEDKDSSIVNDISPLLNYSEFSADIDLKDQKSENAIFFKSHQEKIWFLNKYYKKSFYIPDFNRGETISAYIGIDGGSTSTKGVIINDNEEVLCTAYMLSRQNPVKDAIEILLELREKIESRGVRLLIKGVGFTGYAKDLLKEIFCGDVAIVETVAHTLGTLKYFPNADVICDVGGQDIKIIILKNGMVKDFRLNTQCSAGNGYYLQSTAHRFGYNLEEYAEQAFKAQRVPSFNFGCAVFLEADIVNFQQLGWKTSEILAALARVLPQNVWLYVVQEPNLSRLGRVFVLQGGTHNNLAVVKAQMDFIKERVKDAEIYVHPYNEVAGAIGTALETKRVMCLRKEQNSSFIGFNLLTDIKYSSERGENTRCRFCKNSCMRTIITITAGNTTKKLILANCEIGKADNMEKLLQLKNLSRKRTEKAKNFVDIENHRAFISYFPPVVTSFSKSISLLNKKKMRLKETVIGIPRVLNIYSTAPFFRAYFESLGVKEVRFSSFTSEAVYRKTAGRGSIDPCFPSKVAISHIYQLIHSGDINCIFFPCIRMMKKEIYTQEKHWACPVVAATPESAKAAFMLRENEFEKNNILYLDPVLDMDEPEILEKQIYTAIKPFFGITKNENRKAIFYAYKIWDEYFEKLRFEAEKALEQINIERDVGIVLLGRPYHNDPGINHSILHELNRLGYTIFTIQSLPRKGEIVENLFKNDILQGLIENPLDISDVWPRCYNENSSLKVWAAKFTAKHPNLVALDLSSFRCGHDSPIYSVTDSIFNQSSSPYFTFQEIDENKPESSIKLRVETIDYFLNQYKKLLRKPEKCEMYSMVV